MSNAVQQPQQRESERTILPAVPRWMLALAYIVECVVLAFLFILSLTYTCEAQRKSDVLGAASVTELFTMHHGVPSLTLILGVAAVFAALLLIAQFASRVQRGNLLRFLVITVLAIQIVWIAALELTAFWYPDSESLMDAANALVNGHSNQFAPDYCQLRANAEACAHRPQSLPLAHRYFSLYPFQTGPLVWYVFVAWIFGANNVIAFQILNAVAVTGLVAALWRIGTLIGLDDSGRAVLTALTLTCVPLLMFATFVYPNAVGFTIALAGVALIGQAFLANHAWSGATMLLGGFLICGIGIMFKSTFIIIVLAAFIAVLLTMLLNKRWWQAPVALVGLLLAQVLSKLPLHIIQHVTGQQFGKGMPMSSWLLLGLSHEETASPGWWTMAAIHTFDKAHGDYATQADLIQEALTSRLRYFGQHPSQAWQFFNEKLATEWADPTFMTVTYSQLGPSAHEFTGLPKWLLTGENDSRLFSFENAMQSLVYVLALIGTIAMLVAVLRSLLSKQDVYTTDAHTNLLPADAKMFARTFICAAFLGGFICYVFWEAKGIYTLPFYLLLLPVAAYGTQSCRAGTRWFVRYNRTSQESQA